MAKTRATDIVGHALSILFCHWPEGTRLKEAAIPNGIEGNPVLSAAVVRLLAEPA